MAHDDETPETAHAHTEETTRRGRRLSGDAGTIDAPDGEYTTTDGVSHTSQEEQGSYIDTSEHEEDTSVRGRYSGSDSRAEGEYTDKDQ